MGELLSDRIYLSFVYTVMFVYVLLLLSILMKSLYFKSRDNYFYPFAYVASTFLGVTAIIIVLLFFFDVVKNR